MKQPTPKGHQPDSQMSLNIRSVKEVEVDGIQMGILNNGTPYLTARGLSRICGIDHTNILQLGNNWSEEKWKPRGSKIFELLKAQGLDGETLVIKTNTNGKESHAYTDAVSMAILEYYAFETSGKKSETAINSYRFLARFSIREYIYNRCGYDPKNKVPDSWKNFHERVLLNDSIPAGYFSVFREIADIVIHMINQGCEIDDKTVPDGSVGIHWAKKWNNDNLEEKYGERRKHPHNFPDWFRQALANPIPAWIYPLHALGEFRMWLYSSYVKEKFPTYIKGKVDQGVFPPSGAELLLSAVIRPELESEN